MKRCTKCGRDKERSEFCRQPQMADGLSGKCKECAREYSRERYRRDPAKFAAYEKKRLLDPAVRERINANKRARRRAGNPGIMATEKVSNALQSGRLVREPCECCGATERVDAHHDDYSKPLDVRWLCRRHHLEYHGRIVRAG